MSHLRAIYASTAKVPATVFSGNYADLMQAFLQQESPAKFLQFSEGGTKWLAEKASWYRDSGPYGQHVRLTALETMQVGSLIGVAVLFMYPSGYFTARIEAMGLNKNGKLVGNAKTPDQPFTYNVYIPDTRDLRQFRNVEEWFTQKRLNGMLTAIENYFNNAVGTTETRTTMINGAEVSYTPVDMVLVEERQMIKTADGIKFAEYGAVLELRLFGVGVPVLTFTKAAQEDDFFGFTDPVSQPLVLTWENLGGNSIGNCAISRAINTDGGSPTLMLDTLYEVEDKKPPVTLRAILTKPQYRNIAEGLMKSFLAAPIAAKLKVSPSDISPVYVPWVDMVKVTYAGPAEMPEALVRSIEPSEWLKASIDNKAEEAIAEI